MDIIDLKKLALLGLAGGLLLTASDHNAMYAGENVDSGDHDQEANGCNGKSSCSGSDDSPEEGVDEVDEGASE